MLQQINEQLEKLYCTHQIKDAISIGTWYRIQGDPINFHFVQEDDKYSRIVTNRNFSDWIAWNTGDWHRATPAIAHLANRYGVQWDPNEGTLYIRFRRNEMTIAQAILRLQQAVFVVGSLESV